MTNQPTTYWADKAFALLLPPGAHRADERGKQLADMLGLGGLNVAWGEQQWTRYERARNDANHAHTGKYQPLESGSGPLVHPLSGEPIPTPRVANTSWASHLESLQKAIHGKSEPGDVYRHLWLKQMSDLRLAHTPGDACFIDHSVLSHQSTTAALFGAQSNGDEATLLHFHVGPVQSFIASARRTTDLSLGSYLIAYLAYQAIHSIAHTIGPDAIIYPDLSSLPLYTQRTVPVKKLRASLPNRFMAIVPHSRLQELAQGAAQAVAKAWEGAAKSVKEGLSRLNFKPDLGFDQQINNHLEMDITFQPWGKKDAYKSMFERVRLDLTAQRRRLTHYPKPEQPDNRRTKCTQCGRREQVADRNDWEELRKAFRNSGKQGQSDSSETESLHLRVGEGLCAVCLTKRFAHRWYFGTQSKLLRLSKQERILLRFPSVASIATAPLRHALKRAGADTQAWWKKLKSFQEETLQFTPPGNLLPGLGGPKRTNNHLDLDGTWYYETSYQPDTALRDHDLSANELNLKELTPLKDLLRQLQTLLKSLGEDKEKPHITPYYAVLTIDVDRMGKWLDGTHPDTLSNSFFDERLKDESRVITPALHREISRRQSALASDPLYTIVENDNLGRVIYSGGDDILAFVPLATVWRCLEALCNRFRAIDGLGKKVTLSAGVAITHWRTPLSRAFALSRNAESRAKEEGRDRLVVTVARRSGAVTHYSGQWLLPKLLKDPKVLTALKAADGSAIRFNTLDSLERELRLLAGFDNKKEAIKAIESRAVIHLFGRRVELVERSTDPLASYLLDLCTPATVEQLLAAIKLLRFLAREHDPIIAQALPTLTEVV